MIKSFSFSGFRSFEEKVTIDFSTVDKFQNRKILTENEYSKVIAVYGGPGAGKSTILNALKNRSKEINFEIEFTGELNVFDLDDVSFDEATELYKNNREMFKFAVGILGCCDLGVDDVRIKDNEVIFVHKTEDGREFEMPKESESSGTIRLYCILVGIYMAVKTKGIAIWDEGCILHPHLVKHLVDIFYNQDAQLLIATNISMDWMMENDFIDETQLYLVEKTFDGSMAIRSDKLELRDLSNMGNFTISL